MLWTVDSYVIADSGSCSAGSALGNEEIKKAVIIMETFLVGRPIMLRLSFHSCGIADLVRTH